MPQTSFDIEDAEYFLNRLKNFHEVLQDEWSRVLNQWYNLKSSCYDYHIYQFEEMFERLSSTYSRAIKNCEQCINSLENKIRIAESVNDLEDCLPFLEGLYSNQINSSSAKITSAQRTAYAQKILKGLSHLPKIFLDQAKAKVKGAYARLGIEAVAALIFYTSQSLGYQQINRLLRGQMTKFASAEKGIGWDVTQAKRDYQEHIKFMTEALNKLPNYEGVVFRGSKVEQKQLAKYKVGQIITEQGFTSTSSKLAVAQAFSGNVFYTIVSKTGKAIKDFSEFSGEDEVLFRSGTKFKVLAVENKNGKTYIKMMEV
jgi:NAD:arginine ADP-ribosyltransferase.